MLKNLSIYDNIVLPAYQSKNGKGKEKRAIINNRAKKLMKKLVGLWMMKPFLLIIGIQKLMLLLAKELITPYSRNGITDSSLINLSRAANGKLKEIDKKCAIQWNLNLA